MSDDPALAAPTYPRGNVRTLLESDLVTPKTRAVLLDRLDGAIQADTPPLRALSDSELVTLRAVCERLIPQPERTRPVNLAGAIEDRLARGESKGWRYAVMPPDQQAYTESLAAIERMAQAGHGISFHNLSNALQDAILRDVQRGNVPREVWGAVSPMHFFEELLAEVVESYYSHPLAQEEIGYVGFADAHGWQRIGLDQLQDHEPRAKHVDAG